MESFFKMEIEHWKPLLKNYAAKAITRNVILAVDISYPFLRLQKKESKTAAVEKPDWGTARGYNGVSCCVLLSSDWNWKIFLFKMDLF